jgi:hypothetical protein
MLFFDEEQVRAHMRLLGHADHGVTQLVVVSSQPLGAAPGERVMLAA